MLSRLSPRAKRVIRTVIAVVVLVVVGVLFVRALADNWADVQRADLQFSWNFVVAIVLFAVAVPLSGVLWGLIVRRLAPDARFTMVEAAAVHCASWLLKYIPGQVGSLVNKLQWGTTKGISRTLTFVSFVYENIFLQLASIIPAAVILLASLGVAIFQANWTLLVLPVVAVIPLVALSQRRVLHFLVSLGMRRFSKEPLVPADFLGTGTTIAVQLGYVLPRVINGVGFVLIAIAVSDVGVDTWVPLAATYVVAGAIGILAVFVPSGLGVREAVIVVLASQYVSTTDAILMSIAARLLSTVADVIVAAIYAGLRFLPTREARA